MFRGKCSEVNEHAAVNLGVNSQLGINGVMWGKITPNWNTLSGYKVTQSAMHTKQTLSRQVKKVKGSM